MQLAHALVLVSLAACGGASPAASPTAPTPPTQPTPPVGNVEPDPAAAEVCVTLDAVLAEVEDGFRALRTDAFDARRDGWVARLSVPGASAATVTPDDDSIPDWTAWFDDLDSYGEARAALLRCPVLDEFVYLQRFENGDTEPVESSNDVPVEGELKLVRGPVEEMQVHVDFDGDLMRISVTRFD